MEDEYKNHWQGPYKLKQLKHLPNKSTIRVWFKRALGCTWDTPHKLHSMSLSDLMNNYSNVIRGIYVQTNSLTGVIKRDNKAPIVIIAAIITGLATLFSGIFSSSEPKYNNEINGNNNVTVQGEKNTVILSNDVWEWEDLKGEVEGDFVKIRIAFKIVTDQFRWKLGSHEYLDNGRRMVDELPQYLNSLPDFENALGLVAVGMASQENNQNISVEEDRAERRADNILLALNPHSLAKEKEIYKLNLGVHETMSSLSENETSYQRKIILIGVMDKSSNITYPKFEKCLKEALEYSGGLSFDKNKYSKFDLKTYQIDFKRIEY